MTLSQASLTLSLLLPTLCYAIPPEFTATYLAETYGVTAARATYKLKHKNNSVSFTQHSETIGVAAMFSNATLDETSILSIHDDKLLLDEYRYTQTGDKKNRNTHLKIKWNETVNDKLSGTISGKTGKHPVEINVDTRVWDTLSFQLPIMMSANEKTVQKEIQVLVKGKLKTYSFVNHGAEEITINNNQIKTLKIERKSGNKDKPLFLWLAPSLHNLPVKIEKWKKGKPHITMFLNSATFPSDKNFQFKTEEDFED